MRGCNLDATTKEMAFDLSAYTWPASRLTTSEQMFFHGAPLAHVLRYEQELRSERERRMLISGRPRYF